MLLYVVPSMSGQSRSITPETETGVAPTMPELVLVCFAELEVLEGDCDGETIGDEVDGAVGETLDDSGGLGIDVSDEERGVDDEICAREEDEDEDDINGAGLGTRRKFPPAFRPNNS